jgi:hypothetical protein
LMYLTKKLINYVLSVLLVGTTNLLFSLINQSTTTKSIIPPKIGAA